MTYSHFYIAYIKMKPWQRMLQPMIIPNQPIKNQSDALNLIIKSCNGKLSFREYCLIQILSFAAVVVTENLVMILHFCLVLYLVSLTYFFSDTSIFYLWRNITWRSVLIFFAFTFLWRISQNSEAILDENWKKKL